MDFSHIAQELEIDESEYLSLLKIFETHTVKDLAELRTALANSNFDAVHAAAHSIKGASGSLSLWGIHEAATRICDSVNAATVEPIAAQLSIIQDELELLSRVLTEGKEGG